MSFAEVSEKTSQFYGDHWSRYPLEVQGVIEHLNILFPDGLKGKTVLDAGCGSGVVSIAFSIMGADVLGIDGSPSCVRVASERAKEIGVPACFEQHDLTSLDMGNRAFDIIYSWGVLHHTTDAQGSFDNLVKYLKPGGTIVIAVYLKTLLSGFWNFSRMFYRNRPAALQSLIRFLLSKLLDGVDIVRRIFLKKQPPMMRGTRNEELVNDWLGVPQRTFHTYDEVFGWFRKHGLSYKLTNPATGRFKSTSNFEVVGWK
jgi:2-polyprenyl-6-hydroxyphenyl methylase/3-demethylubiquinone-9 3-methyltransferase